MDVGSANNVDIVVVNNMKKFNHYCPFCRLPIPKVYITKTNTTKKRHKKKIKLIKEVIGEDWDAHTAVCSRLNEFLKNTK